MFASFLTTRSGEALEHVRRVAGGEVAGVTWICGKASAGGRTVEAAAHRLESRRAGYFPLAELAALGVGVLEGLPQLQCLCIDDLEAVVGRLEWEKEIFGLLREVEECGGALVMAARPPPALLPWALPDLGSRCAAAAVLQLRALDEMDEDQALQLRARLAASSCPRRPRAGCSAVFRATCAGSMACSIPWMKRPSRRSGGSRCRSSARG